MDKLSALQVGDGVRVNRFSLRFMNKAAGPRDMVCRGVLAGAGGLRGVVPVCAAGERFFAEASASIKRKSP